MKEDCKNDSKAIFNKGDHTFSWYKNVFAVK